MWQTLKPHSPLLSLITKQYQHLITIIAIFHCKPPWPPSYVVAKFLQSSYSRCTGRSLLGSPGPNLKIIHFLLLNEHTKEANWTKERAEIMKSLSMEI